MKRFFRYLFTLGSLLLLSFLIKPCPAVEVANSKIVVVSLHAQVEPSDDLVVGSVLTTSGLRSSLSNSSAAVYSNRTFYPFHYAGLAETCHDMVIIEGYFSMIHSFIHEVRRISREQLRTGSCPGKETPVRVVFWSLDPDFPEPTSAANFDVDAILTNSYDLLNFFSRVSPTMHTGYLPLAADTALFHPPPVPSPGAPTDVVFVGSAGSVMSGSKRFLREVLLAMVEILESKPSLNLKIYGAAWDQLPEFRDYYEGVLPLADLPAVYRNSLCVIGVTMDTQRESGMINNRVYEVLASGVPFISEWFQSIYDLAGDVILYYEEGNVRVGLEAAINRILNMVRKAQSRRGGERKKRGGAICSFAGH